MEAEQIRKIRYSAIYKAERKGYSREWAEDFAQDVLLKIYSGRKATVDQLLVDRIRTTQGDSRNINPSGDPAEPNGFELDPNAFAMGVTCDTQPDMVKYLNLLKGNERVVVSLKFIWDMTDPEIGAVLGLSHSRVSQLLTGVKNRLRTQIYDMDRVFTDS